jgi:hypothetical protein
VRPALRQENPLLHGSIGGSQREAGSGCILALAFPLPVR